MVEVGLVVGVIVFVLVATVVTDVLESRRRRRVSIARRDARRERELKALRDRERLILEYLRMWGPCTSTALSRSLESRPPTGAFRDCLSRLEARGLVLRDEDREWVAL